MHKYAHGMRKRLEMHACAPTVTVFSLFRSAPFAPRHATQTWWHHGYDLLYPFKQYDVMLYSFVMYSCKYYHHATLAAACKKHIMADTYLDYSRKFKVA